VWVPEHIALIALVAIAVHGLALLGDHWLKPGLRGIAVPFAISYRAHFTGLGVIAGYLAVLVGPSFYLRRRIGARRWRQLHRATVIVWILAVIHTLGAGSDGTTMWLRGVVLGSGIPIVYLMALRVLQGDTRVRRAPSRTADARTAAIQHAGRIHGSARRRHLGGLSGGAGVTSCDRRFAAAILAPAISPRVASRFLRSFPGSRPIMGV
jgi:hypothetical protein